MCLVIRTCGRQIENIMHEITCNVHCSSNSVLPMPFRIFKQSSANTVFTQSD
jgi:hypothetical protein